MSCTKILFIIVSCKTSQVITKYEIPQKTIDRRILTLETTKKTYELHNYNLHEEYIAGDIYSKHNLENNESFIVVFLNSAYLIPSEEFLIKDVEIPNSMIDRIIYKHPNVPLTILTVTGVSLIVGIVVFALTFEINLNWSGI